MLLQVCLRPCSGSRVHLTKTIGKTLHARFRSNSASPENAGKVNAAGVIFSAIQPTGIPHLGNILGALLNWKRLQTANNDTVIFAIAGWHALTLPQISRQLKTARMEMLAALLAIGVDPQRSTLFFQEDNPYHTDLAWILNCITPMGKLRRMTTWKSKLATSRNARDESEVDESLLNVGLFTYPVLQAADILLYKATHVPVGEDQQQHLELCRDLADTFNRTFKGQSPLFPLPQTLITPTPRVLSLKDPTSKMSKSAPDAKSRILLSDTKAQIESKIRGAVTDTIVGVTYDPVNRPGAANLLTILAACLGEEVTDVAKRYHNKGHGELKADVAQAVEMILEKPRREFDLLRNDEDYLTTIADHGATKATKLSEATMNEVRSRLGYRVEYGKKL